jgi:hypothetical protein
MDSSHSVKVKHHEPTTTKQSNTCRKTEVFRIASSVRRPTTDIANVHLKSHEYVYK